MRGVLDDTTTRGFSEASATNLAISLVLFSVLAPVAAEWQTTTGLPLSSGRELKPTLQKNASKSQWRMTWPRPPRGLKLGEFVLARSHPRRLSEPGARVAAIDGLVLMSC